MFFKICFIVNDDFLINEMCVIVLRFINFDELFYIKLERCIM